MHAPLLDSRSRVMLIAPHPDDESLAAGVFLQKAVAAKASVRVIYGTDGDNNAWPQRFLERKWRLRDADRCRWGHRRRAEAINALRMLRVDPADVEFLSLPDQGISDLLIANGRATVAKIASLILAWQPTHLLLPSAMDTHPDHSSLAILIRLAIAEFLPLNHNLSELSYLVHGPSLAFTRSARQLSQTRLERNIKRRAIACHQTQVALSRRRFFAYANRPETFALAQRNAPIVFDGPIRSARRVGDALHIEVAFAMKPLRAEETALHLLGHDSTGNNIICFCATLPGRPSDIAMVDCAAREKSQFGRFKGDAFRAEIILPAGSFAAHRSLFIKLDRRVWFFDEAGWFEIPAEVPKPVVYHLNRTRSLSVTPLALR
jgi:LmbE family N-acetylglucosaminyl deacetylase